MTSAILLTGGTGTLGRHVTPLLCAAGYKVRSLSRQARPDTDGVEYVVGDLLKDEGIEPAVAGAEVVLHLAGSAKGDDAATRNLARAAAHAGVRHLVCISVIGADKVPIGYFRAKLGAERAVADSGVPWTVLRAAQFHDLTLTAVRAMARLPLVPAPGGLRLQPVDARDVAARLVELAGGDPAGLVAGLAGPRVYTMADLTRGYLQARGKRRPMFPVRVPGGPGRAYRAGANLDLDADKGTRSWEDFLAERAR
ncbi:NAD(P)H-binding protein [Streptomyces sp. NPDC088194]|uniref:SDR family oxidoreductase n=1 Tax=Streptomyces sp. NPDC088194 TaxID=3154931 RepID=UPI003450D348